MKQRRLKADQKRARLAEIFERGPERARKLSAWVRGVLPAETDNAAKMLPREPLPIERFEENESYILVRYEPFEPKHKIGAVILDLHDYDGALLRTQNIVVDPSFQVGQKLLLHSAIGPTV
jgi:hypothetical protein